MTLLWIAIALAFAVVEVWTVGLFAGFLALGALGAAIAAFAGYDIVVQSIVFAAVSVLGIVVVRRPLVGYLQGRHGPEVLSGAAAMVGQTAPVVDAIGGPEGRGHVRIRGEVWPALSRDGRPLEAGVSVRIVEIRGATLIVELAPGRTSHP